MQTVPGNLFTRDDTFFGVCEGLGEDTGIHSNLFRLAFTLGAFFNPVAALAVYGGVGAAVLAVRLLVPNLRPAAPRVAAPAPAVNGAAARVAVQPDAAAPVTAADTPLPLAA